MERSGLFAACRGGSFPLTKGFLMLRLGLLLLPGNLHHKTRTKHLLAEIQAIRKECLRPWKRYSSPNRTSKLVGEQKVNSAKLLQRSVASDQ